MAAWPSSRLELIAERPTVPDGYTIDRNPRHFGTAAIQISGEKDAKLAQKMGQLQPFIALARRTVNPQMDFLGQMLEAEIERSPLTNIG